MTEIEKTKLEVDEFNEVTHYFYIDALGGMIWRTNHDAGHGRLTITPEMQKDLENMSELQQYCVNQLTKFGVDPESAKDKPDGDYWKWFRHWDDWKKAMSFKEWQHFDDVMSKEEDYSELLPKNKWNEITT